MMWGRAREMNKFVVHHPAEQPDQLRHALVERMKRKGLLNVAAVEAAFQAVDRHLFLPHLTAEQAYKDEAIPTKRIQHEVVSSSSQPSMMAIMLEQLDLHPGQHVLEIGAGTGYNAALIAHIVGPTGRVTTIDIDDDIVRDARRHLNKAGFPAVHVSCADGGYGYVAHAPYDRIILTVGAWDILPAWQHQLCPTGRLVLPLSFYGLQKATALVRQANHLISTALYDCGFMRLRGVFVGPERRVRSTRFPHMTIETYTKQSSAAQVDALLQSPYVEHVLPVAVSLHDLFGSLWLWLALHHYTPCSFSLHQPTETAPLPTLFGDPSSKAEQYTVGFVRQQRLCLCLPPLGALLATEEVDWITAFPLHVRLYNPAPTTLPHLMDAIERWEHAGRPKNNALSLHVYPRDVPYLLEPDAFLIRKEWTNMVVQFRTQ